MVRPIALTLPLTVSDVRRLKAGDVVSLSGRIVTGRDRVHRYLAGIRPPKEELPFELLLFGLLSAPAEWRFMQEYPMEEVT